MSGNFDSVKRYQTCMRMVGKIMALNVEKIMPAGNNVQA